MFSLSPRLRAVAELVTPGARLADVGTDHGRLPVWLVCQGIVPRAVATDLRSGPLSRGQALAERWAVSDRVAFRLCDGLSAVDPTEAEVVTIAGMGGETIAGILRSVSWTRKGERRYILQPMSGMDGLRRYLSEDGFSVEREILVPEGETLYVILLVKPGKMRPFSQGEIWVGRQTPGMESPLRSRYLDQELRKLRWAAEGLAQSQTPEDRKKLAEYERTAREVARMKEEWEQWRL